MFIAPRLVVKAPLYDKPNKVKEYEFIKTLLRELMEEASNQEGCSLGR